MSWCRHAVTLFSSTCERALCCCHARDTETGKAKNPPFFCEFSDLLPSSTVILLKVSTKTHCHSPEPSLPCLSSPLFPPSSLPPSSLHPTILYCSFCARKQKICLPHTRGCLPVSHKVQTAWESTALPAPSTANVCVCTVNNTRSYFGEVVSLPLCK